MTLRQGPSGPVIAAQLLLASGTVGTVVNGARLSLTQVRAKGGISIVSNRLHVSEPGWYQLSGQVSALVSSTVDQVFSSRIVGNTQGQESQIPFNDGQTGAGIGAAPLVNLFNITDPTTQEIEIVNLSGSSSSVQGASLLLERVA